MLTWRCDAACPKSLIISQFSKTGKCQDENNARKKLKLFLHLRNKKPVLAWLYFSIGRLFRINFRVHMSLAVCLPDCKCNTM